MVATGIGLLNDAHGIMCDVKLVMVHGIRYCSLLNNDDGVVCVGNDGF